MGRPFLKRVKKKLKGFVADRQRERRNIPSRRRVLKNEDIVVCGLPRVHRPITLTATLLYYSGRARGIWLF